MRPVRIVILLAFGLVCFIAIVAFLNSSGRDAALYTQAFLASMTRAVGFFISAVAAISLLLCAFDTVRTNQLAAFATALTGGLLMIEPHWSIAIALGAIVVTLLVREAFLPPKPPSSDGNPADFLKA